ncbi:MAG TPA: OmpA family protein [Acidobacteriaceae bacterium]|jgi:peptidoglycan-associated lipoprotein|nr:OmpA family protein [Acidobacteriaceae bacterium]
MNLTTRSFRTFTQLAALAAILGIAGCHHKTAAAPEPAPPQETAAAPTATLSADPLAIDLGQSVVLNWRTENATAVTIDGIGSVNLNGTTNASPSTSTNFHLTATGPGGSTEASVRVTVRIPEVPTAPTAGPADQTDDTLFHQNVQDVFFDYDSSDIRPDAATSIAAAAAFLTAHPSAKVLIGGYCDDRGSAEYNLALGETRANAAKNALVAAGVDASRLRVISYGKEKQFCTDENDACWQQNRRAQFSLDR